MGNFSWILAPKKGEPVDPRAAQLISERKP